MTYFCPALQLTASILSWLELKRKHSLFVSDMFFQQISKILIDNSTKIFPLLANYFLVPLQIYIWISHFSRPLPRWLAPLKRNVFELATLKMCSVQSSGLIPVSFNGLSIGLLARINFSQAGILKNKQKKTYFSGGSSNTVALPILLVREVRGLSSRSRWSRPAKEAGVRGISMPSSIPIGSMEWPPMAPMPRLSRVPGTDLAMDLLFLLLGLLWMVEYWVSRLGGSIGCTGTWKVWIVMQ